MRGLRSLMLGLALLLLVGAAPRIERRGAPPTAVLVEVVGGSILASGGYVTQAGAFQATTAPVALTNEGTNYGRAVAGDTITIAGAGLTAGDTGEIRSNSDRAYIALSSLGITLSDTSPRPITMRILCDDLTDNGEARAGNITFLSWLGVGSTTALVGVGIQRPASGSDTWTPVWFRSTGTTFNAGTANVLNLGFFGVHDFPAADNGLYWGALASDGGTRGTGAVSTGAISASLPTHIVWAWRASAGASGAVYQDCRGLYLFGGGLEDL